MAATTTDTKDLYVTLPLEVHTRLRVAAGARGLTYAQYIERLVELHEAVRFHVDSPPAFSQDDGHLLILLRTVGLETVTA